jgi:hypothetical protein
LSAKRTALKSTTCAPQYTTFLTTLLAAVDST